MEQHSSAVQLEHGLTAASDTCHCRRDRSESCINPQTAAAMPHKAAVQEHGPSVPRGSPSSGSDSHSSTHHSIDRRRLWCQLQLSGCKASFGKFDAPYQVNPMPNADAEFMKHLMNASDWTWETDSTAQPFHEVRAEHDEVRNVPRSWALHGPLATLGKEKGLTHAQQYSGCCCA